jgi:tetratricopeptide (TPR) repeat protein
VCWILLIGSLTALWPVQRALDLERGPAAETSDVLYLPSGNLLRQLSVGYQALLADIYWTRVVQYFGRKRLAQSTRFDVLGPLLRITTDLDPRLIIAYRYGSVFLAEKPPGGAGRPAEALELLRRGIVRNPQYWRLWEDLGFIYYWDLKDYPQAAKVFQIGSERPGALPWMKVLAATVAAKGGGYETSRLLWLDIYRHADNDSIQMSALAHLMALDAQDQLRRLSELLALYRRNEGQAPGSFSDLVAAGYLKAGPRDPSGAPYVISPEGQASLSQSSKVDLRLLQ